MTAPSETDRAMADVAALPASFAQQRFWLLDQVNPGAAAYTVPMAIRLVGQLDTGAVAAALNAVVARHESLRTVFALEQGEVVQLVYPVLSVDLPVVELPGYDATERERNVQAALLVETNRPFDLAVGPLIRGTLFKVGDDDHALSLNLHHAIADGWSIGILFRELSEAYSACIAGTEPDFPALPLQYPDFSVWQRRAAESGAIKRQLAWWVNQLRAPLPALDIPTDRTRPAALTYAGDKGEAILPTDLVQQVRALARTEGATAYVTFLAAFHVLLSRWTNQQDVIVGSITSGRQRPETQPLIGLFVNTLAIRADLSGNGTFRELMAQVRETVLGALANQDVPFEMVVEAVQPDWDRSRSALFQAAFQLFDGLDGQLAFPGVSATRIPTAKDTTKFELTLSLAPLPDGGLRAAIEYSTELFDVATIDRMQAQYRRLLEAIVRDPDCRVHDVGILPPAERARLLDEWNATDQPYPDTAVLHDLFEMQVDRTPEGVALAWDGGTMTFAELERRANRLAHRLVSAGIGPEVGVGICAERSPDLVVAMLATLKAGGYYVPLDPEYPADRLAYMVTNARLPVVLVQAPLRTLIPATSALLLTLGADNAECADTRLPCRAQPDSLAYVIYTSGSTGQPKGVMIPRRAVVNYIHWMQSAYPVGSADAVLQKAPASFDASVWEFYLPLLTGARLVLARAGGQQDPRYLADAVNHHRITVLQLVPSQLLLMLEAGTLGECGGLRRVFSGGEALPGELLGQLAEMLPHVAVTNLYGPTEATVYATHWTLERASFDGHAPIGRPIANDRVYILDATLQLAPIGVPGEVCISGVGVGRGYLNQPALTAEKFVADPFRPAPGARMYRTGDLARWRADGTLDYLGRIDHQVKLRGFRIELGEIEAALASVPGVRGAVVVVREDVMADKRLVAYVVPNQAGAVSPDALRAHVKARLPEYMVPSQIVLLDAFPLSPNGKVDRKALPAPDAAAAEAPVSTAPRTPVEQAITDAMAEVLRRGPVGVHDGFFDLGGHSLLAMRLLSRLRQALDPGLTLQAIFEHPTAAALAAIVEAAGRTGTTALAIPRRGDPTRSPLSFAQELIWVQAEMDRTLPTYNIPLLRRLRGRFDLAAWQQALNEVIARHASLRSVVQLGDAGAEQLVLPPRSVLVEVADCRTAVDPLAAASALAQAAAAQPFDLGHDLLLRSSVLSLGADDHLVLVLTHHLAIDGASLATLWSDLLACYNAARRGAPANLPALPLEYGDYAAWQRERLQGAALDELVEFWTTTLSGTPATLDLPTDRPRGRATFGPGAVLGRTFPLPLLDALTRLAASQGTTLYMTVLAAWQVLLHRYSGQDDFVVGSPVGGRPTPETEGIVGDFVNTVLLRNRFDDDPTFAEVLQRVRVATIAAFGHDELPLEHLATVLRERTGSAPQFQVLFTLQNNPPSTARFDELTVESVPVHVGTANFELSLGASVTATGLRVGLEYRADLFDAATIERMLHHFEVLLAAVAAAPGTGVSSLPILGAAEEHRLLVEWNDTAAVVARQTLPQLLAATAHARGDRPAVHGALGTLTYAELDTRANQLARHLAACGVEPGSTVAVALERSPALVVALLAILKARAAYLPLDPHHPPERLACILADANVAAVVTEHGVAERLTVPASASTVILEDSRAAIAKQPDTPPAGAGSPDDIAYVIYTSGSTGQPKGVEIPHSALVNFLEAMRRAPGFESTDVLLALTTVSFDIAGLEIWLPLLVGGQIHIAPHQTGTDGALLAGLLAASGATHVQATPTTWRLLLEAGWTGDSQLTVLCGGEAIPAALVDLIAPRCKAFWNMYGPTETTIWSAARRLTAGEPVAIGGPILNTQLYVLNRASAPQPIGVAGELCIGGAGLARGYHARPELTAERFVPNPFGAPGSRIYRTGDRVRWRADGTIEFLGRLDNQVKLRGFRIELGEVEAAVAAQSGIAATVAVVREDVPGDPRLVAYVEWKPGWDGDLNVVRDGVARLLPGYMVPSQLVELDALPLNPAGKVDRKALPAPDGSVGRVIDAPQSALEADIARQMANVLSLDAMGRTEDFFQLGGHSLLAMRLVARLRQGGVPAATLPAIFAHSTPARLASALAGEQPGSALVIPRRTDAAQSPLSFAQELIWVQAEMDRSLPAYNVPMLRRLRGPFDTTAWQRALDRIVARHASLRSVVSLGADGPVQRVLEPHAVPMEIVRCDHQRDPLARAGALAQAAAAQPFDLERDLLLRSTVYVLGDDDHAVLLLTHHIAVDGTSMAIIWSDLLAEYEATRRGVTADLPALALEYGDYAAWQRERLHGAALDSLVGFWTAALAGTAGTLELPTDRPRGRALFGPGAVLGRTVPATTLAEVNRLAASQGATLYMTLMAAWQVLLHRYSGQADFVVASPVGGRPTPETEGIVGDFVNTVLLRARFENDPTFAELLACTKMNAIAAFGHDELPLEHLATVLRETTGSAPEFQAVFSLQNQATPVIRFDDLTVEPARVHVGTAKFDLFLGAGTSADGLRLVVEYRTDLFNATTIERMLEHFEVLLAAATAAPSARVSQLPLLSVRERQLLLDEWSAPASYAYPRDATVHELFAAQAASAPDAIAIESGTRRLTYGELDVRADRLAARMARSGAGPGSRVGICLDRSPELVIAILATLKTGAAYVPLDPDYPVARLAFLVADSAVPVIVTEKRYADRFAPAAGVKLLDIKAALRPTKRNDFRPAPGGPLDPAYVMYTSGSTGQPKGVVVPHRAIVRLLRSSDYVQLDGRDVLLLMAPTAFDASTFEVWGALLNGGRLAIAPPGPLEFGTLGEAIARHGVTTIFLTTALFNQAVESFIDILRPLRQLLTGGEAHSITHFAKARATIPDCRLLHVYGPTENTTFSTWHEVTDEDLASGVIPIGRPIAHSTACILDAAMQPAPIGIPGELHVGGDGVALAYLDRPGLTAEKFVPDPFRPGERLYRTGDRAKWRRDGTIEFLGRRDYQIKLRGHRIELGEVEAIVGALPGVAAVVAIVREDTPGEARLVAYLTWDAGHVGDLSQVREAIARTLPTYMVPSQLIALDALPLTPNGKVDRRALPAPDATGGGRVIDAPRTALEGDIAALMASVLKLDAVGRHENFFELGGHSLVAMRLVARLRQNVASAASLPDVFANPTPAGLASALASATSGRAPAIPRRADTAESPLSFAQELIWVRTEMDPTRPAYNVPLLRRVRGPFDIAAWQQALDQVVTRHAALRTVVRLQGEVAIQQVQSACAVPCDVVDCRDAPNPFADAESQATAAAERPFDLDRDLLLRSTVCVLGEQDHLVLLLTHHIAVDGASLAILWTDLLAEYHAAGASGTADLAPLALEYGDFAAWQRDRLSGTALDTLVSNWTDALAGVPATLELPTDRPRGRATFGPGAAASRVLPASLLADVHRLAASQGTTLYMTLLAAWQVLLYRWSGQGDFVVGSPVAGRPTPESESIVGDFVNTVLLRAQLDDDATFAQVLGRARSTAITAFANDELPLERLSAVLRETSGTAPLLQVLFVLQNNPASAATFHGLAVETVGMHIGAAKFDLSLEAIARTDGLKLGVEYRTDLFDPATIERMLEHFEVLLTAAVASPAMAVSRLPLLSAAEHDQVVTGWNDTAVAYPDGAETLTALLERQAVRTPDADAVRFGELSLSFTALHARANQLARHLRALGVGPGVLVALCADRSLDLVVALLGILKAGGAYVPIDPEYPAERVAFMLDDTAAPVLLTQQHLVAALPRHAGRTVCLDADWPAIATQPASVLAVTSGPDDLAYMIFTSGSTGRPKGALNTHRGIVNRLLWMQDHFRLGAGDAVLQRTPFSFDVSVWEFFLPLMTGAPLVLAAPGGHRDAAYLARVIREQRITMLHFVPSMLRAFLAEPASAGCRGIREVICSGEALAPDLVEACLARLPARLTNLYGPTEAAVDVTCWTCSTDDGRGSVPIGRPIANTQTYVLDARGAPVPIGVAGELYLGGVQVGRGYHNRPELTAEKFVPSAFHPGGRLYRTGDQARWRADGALEYLGRLDFQVKLRGFRIELGEIEATIAAQPGVSAAVAMVREDLPGDPRLVAYLTVQDGMTVDIAALRDAVGRALPGYMVPAHLVVLDALPLTPNGKIDRRALPAPDAADGGRVIEAPESALEGDICSCMAEVLGLDAVGRNEDFFRLGGHSLLAMRLVARLRRTAAPAVSLQAVFAHATPGGLARALTGVEQGVALTIPRRPGATESPLSFAQELIWVQTEMDRSRPAYNVPLLRRLRGPFNIAAWQRALDQVVERHAALRSVVRMSAGGAVQQVRPPSAVPVDLVDCSPGADPLAEALALARQAAARPFELGEDLLLRSSVYAVAPDDHLVLVLTHHIAVDGASLAILWSDLLAAYDAACRGARAEFSPLALEYGDYAAWQRERLQPGSAALDALVTYWTGALAGVPATLELPTDRPRGRAAFGPGALVARTLRRQLLTGINRLSEAYGATMFMVLLAVWEVLFHRYATQDDFVIGSPIGGRPTPETEQIIGDFVNTVLLRAQMDGNSAFVDVLRQVRDTTIAALAHDEMPLEHLAAVLREQTGTTPQFQVTFTVHAGSAPAPQVRELTVEPSGVHIGTAKFELSISADVTPEGLRIGIEYRTDLFDSSTIEGYIDRFEMLLEQFIENPSWAIDEVPLLSERQRNSVLDLGGRRRVRAFPVASSITDVFVTRARETPDALALTWQREHTTYEALLRRAASIATTIRNSGVKPGDFVGLHMERSREMVPAVLGILMAGAAYVPIDAGYPMDRVNYILEDSGARLLLTDRTVAVGRVGAVPSMLCVEEVSTLSGELAAILAALGSVSPDYPAYMIYTSGSTGVPKGVVVTHRNVMRLFAATDEWFGFGNADVWTLFHSIAFDFSVWEIWGALLYGGRLVVVPFATTRSPEEFHALLRTERVSILNQTPSAFVPLIAVDASHPPDAVSLRTVIFGGEALDPQNLRPWFDRHGDQHPRLINMYGITETTVHVTYRPLRSDDVDRGSVIGVPIPDLHVYVLDARGAPVPVGVPGELYVGGPGVAREYWNRPDLNFARFLPDAFGIGSFARMYRSGDRVRFLADGDIEYLGRLDHQVKIRGFRIELGEIDAVLSAQPGVRANVTVIHTDPNGNTSLASYVVLDSSGPAAGALKDALRARLPEYMVPSTITALDALPLTPNGKIDRKALPAPATAERREVTGPETPEEAILTRLWAQILPIQAIDRRDNFFDIGGHSLLAVKLGAEIARVFRFPVPVRVLFDHPTLQSMASAIAECAPRPGQARRVAELLLGIEAEGGTEAR